MPKVLISDSMSNVAQKIFEKNNITVDVKTGLSEDEIIKIIPEYDGMVVRSATKVTKKIIEAAKNLKVIGRAGAGVDNIDVPSAMTGVSRFLEQDQNGWKYSKDENLGKVQSNYYNFDYLITKYKV